MVTDRRDLVAALGGSRAAYIPELSSNPEFVAVLWKQASIDGLAKLIRQSAFAQEVLVQDSDEARLKAFRRSVPAVTTDLWELSQSVTVAIGWNYLIESEGALTHDKRQGRIQLAIDLLLHPYRNEAPSAASLKLRRAKKTTLSLSHDLHIYKAKFFPRMVRALINIFGTSAGAIFDPFCGSGTALLEASLLGRDSFGIDIDPICQLVARTKVKPFLNATGLINELDVFENALANPGQSLTDLNFPLELAAKIARRDKIDGTAYLPEIKQDVAIVAAALEAIPPGSVYRELLCVLASDAVTKKVRYRFIGVGNGRYTIEIIKQRLIERLREKLERCRQLASVFGDLRDILGMKIGQISVTAGDARDSSSWPVKEPVATIITSPPYLPASSGREHYASSRALGFAILGLNPGEQGYYEMAPSGSKELEPLNAYPEASRLLEYLASDASPSADPQRDAMRFLRKAIPTRQYLADVSNFLRNAQEVMRPDGNLLLVIAHQHVFYSHRRQEIEHIVSGVKLYGQIAERAGLDLIEALTMELLKSAASRARPRAKDDYSESIMVFRPRAAAARQLA